MKLLFTCSDSGTPGNEGRMAPEGPVARATSTIPQDLLLWPVDSAVARKTLFHWLHLDDLKAGPPAGPPRVT